MDDANRASSSVALPSSPPRVRASVDATPANGVVVARAAPVLSEAVLVPPAASASQQADGGATSSSPASPSRKAPVPEVTLNTSQQSHAAANSDDEDDADLPPPPPPDDAHSRGRRGSVTAGGSSRGGSSRHTPNPSPAIGRHSSSSQFLSAPSSSSVPAAAVAPPQTSPNALTSKAPLLSHSRVVSGGSSTMDEPSFSSQRVVTPPPSGAAHANVERRLVSPHRDEPNSHNNHNSREGRQPPRRDGPPSRASRQPTTHTRQQHHHHQLPTDEDALLALLSDDFAAAATDDENGFLLYDRAGGGGSMPDSPSAGYPSHQNSDRTIDFSAGPFGSEHGNHNNIGDGAFSFRGDAAASGGISGSAAAELQDVMRQFGVFRKAFYDLQGRCQQVLRRIHREQSATLSRRLASEAQLRRLQAQQGLRRVRLNVGGTYFEVSESILKRYPGSFFSVLLDGNFPVDVDDSGAIFIDRDPVVFRDILYFLRNGRVPPVPSMPHYMMMSWNGNAADGSAPSSHHHVDPMAHHQSAGSLAGVPTAPRGTTGGGGGAAAAGLRHPPSGNGQQVAQLAGSAASGADWRLLEEEARFFGLTELCMLLTADRGVWLRPDQSHVDGAVPTPRCFAAAVLVDVDTVYYYGGCTSDDKFFDACYALRVGETTRAALNAAAAVGNSSSATNANNVSSSSSAAAADGATVLGSAVRSNNAQQHQMNSSASASRSPADASPVAAGGAAEFGGAAAAAAGDGANAASARITTFTWEKVRHRYGTPPNPRSGHTMTLVHGHLVVLGGNNSISMEPGNHVFNLAARGWSPVRSEGEAFTPRSGHSVTLIRDELYLIGGKQIFPTMQTYSDVLIGRFDPETSVITWRRAPLDVDIEQRAYHSAVGYGQRIFVFGGIVNNVYCRELAIYDTVLGTWQNVTTATHPGYAPPPPRSGHLAVLYGHEMVVFGSYSEEGPHMSLLALNLHTLEWRAVETRGQAPLRRAAPSGAVIPADGCRGIPAKLLVFGGFDIAARRCFNEMHVISL